MPSDLPEAGVENARVARIHRKVRSPGLVVHEEDLLPHLATVLGAEDAPLGVGTPDMTLHGDVHDVWILRMDADARDLARVFQAHVLPAPAAIGRFVDAVTVRDIAADRGLPGADVDDIGIRLGDGNGSDRTGPEVLVGEDLPVGSPIRRPPDAAARAAKIERVRLMPHPRDRRRASPPIRADVPELQSLESVGEGLRLGRFGCGRRGGRPRLAVCR